MFALSCLPIWGWLVLGMAPEQRRATARPSCCKLRGGRAIKAPAICQPLAEDRDLGFSFSFAVLLFGFGVNRLLFKLTYTPDADVGPLVIGFGGSLLFCMFAADRLRKRRKAQARVAALQGVNAAQIVVV